MKKKTKFMIAGTTVLVLGAAVGGTVILTSAATKTEDIPVMPNTVAVERMDLSNKISLSGTVKSAEISTVKSSLSNVKVKSVNFRVGDDVKKGDVIAEFDDTEIQEKLAEAKKKLENTKTKNGLDRSAADRNRESTLSAADKSVKDAEKAVKDAQKAYDEACKKDNDVYKEYLEALDKKNKAYDKFKPYEKKAKQEDKDEKEEREKDYNKACEKVTQLEAALAAASEKLAAAETAVKDTSSKLSAARDSLGQVKQQKLLASQATVQEPAEDMPEEGYTPVSIVSSDNYDASISSAEKLFSEAETMLKNAQAVYDSAAKEYNTISKELLQATKDKNAAYDKYRLSLGSDGSEKGIELESKYKEACDKFDEKDKELKEANDKVDAAKDELNKQKELKKEAEAKSVKDRADLDDTDKSTKLTVDDTLEGLEKDIKELEDEAEKCTVRATADGVITSLNVKEDDMFTGGEVAVIQDSGDLIISANADQYDIANIEKGMLTRITVKAVGDYPMEGTLSFAAPTPETKDSQGGQSIEYPIESEITDPAPGLRLGMNAKLEIISEERLGVLAVPDECIQINENGEYYVDTVDEAGSVTPVIVEYGMKSDYYSEIEGSGLTEGMQVVMPEQDIDMGMDDMMLF